MSRADTPAAPAGGPTLSERGTALFGAMLVAVGPISMALYTPAMPALAEAFGASLTAVKITLTAYFAGFAAAQLICGPLSDAYGRKSVAAAFLALYLGGSVAAALATTIDLLILSRLVQGIGAAVGVAISRAIVRDNFTGQQSARILNTIGIWLALGPALSPTIGGVVLELAGWQAIFLAMVAYGGALLTVVVFLMPETNRTRDPGRANPRRLASAYGTLISSSRFLRPASVLGLAIGGLYANATMLPFVLIEHVGLTPTEFGLGMIFQSGSFIAGGLVTRRLLRRADADRLVLPGLILCATGGVALSLSALLLEPSFLGIMLPVAVFAFSLALFMPALTTNALAPFPEMAGSAGALMGFLQMGSGFAGSALAAVMGDPLVAIGIVVPFMTIAALSIELAAGRSTT